MCAAWKVPVVVCACSRLQGRQGGPFLFPPLHDATLGSRGPGHPGPVLSVSLQLRGEARFGLSEQRGCWACVDAECPESPLALAQRQRTPARELQKDVLRCALWW